MLLQLGAELQGEDVRARILNAEPLDGRGGPRLKRAFASSCATTSRLESIAKRLEGHQASQSPGGRMRDSGGQGASANRAGEGEVTLVMMLDLQTEVEMKLPGRFRVSPQVAGALKAVSGVIDVQTV